METDTTYSEPSYRACERETTTSAEQWSNWTTNQIRSAIEDERERTFALLAELLAQIQRDVIPETVATLPALRGPVGPAGKLPVAKEWLREKVYYEAEAEVVTYDGATYQALHDALLPAPRLSTSGPAIFPCSAPIAGRSRLRSAPPRSWPPVTTRRWRAGRRRRRPWSRCR